VFGNAGAAAPGKTDIGKGKRRRIVDAVSHHGNAAALPFQFGHKVGLAARRLAAECAFGRDAELFGKLVLTLYALLALSVAAAMVSGMLREKKLRDDGYLN